jgi:hypothetical protein
MMKLLALQGGGCRGKAQAVALRELEMNGDTPLWQRFGIVGGTSVGAIIGAAVSLGVPMKAVNDFFDQAAPEIFEGSWWCDVRRLWQSKYGAMRLEAALKQIFGKFTLSDCKTKFICTAFDTKSGRNVYFQNYGETTFVGEEIIITPDTYGDLPLWQIVRASAAAQTYFPAFKSNDMVLIDGGNTGSAAPDMVCLSEALEMGWMLSEIQMLSLGTGASKWKGGALRDPGLLRAGVATISIQFSGSNAQEVWQAASVLGPSHCRLDPDLQEDYELDDASAETLSALELAMNQTIARNWKKLKPFLAGSTSSPSAGRLQGKEPYHGRHFKNSP